MATLDSDNFNRSDESLDAGSWIEDSGDWNVGNPDDNRAFVSSGGTPSHAIRSVSAYSTADYKVSAECAQQDGNPRPGVLGRAVTDATDYSYYWARIRPSNDTWEFGHRQTGTMTTITSGSLTLDFAVDYLVRLEMQGTTIRMFIDGTQYGGDQTDSTLSSAGVGGLHLSNGANDASGGGWDDFLVEDFAGAALLAQPAADTVTVSDVDTVVVDPLLAQPSAETVTAADVDTVAVDPLLAQPSAETVTVSDVDTVAVDPVLAQPAADTVSVSDVDTVVVDPLLAQPAAETISVSDVDTVAVDPLLAQPAAENVTVSDVDTVAVDPLLAQPAAETVSVSDVDTVVVEPLVVSEFEAITATDDDTVTVNDVGALTVSQFEPVTVSDVDTVVVDPLLAQPSAETVTATDVDVVVLEPLVIVVNEAVTATDDDVVAVQTQGATINVSDPVTVADDIRFGINLGFAPGETLTATDTATVYVSPLVVSAQEPVTATDVDDVETVTPASIFGVLGVLTVGELVTGKYVNG